MLKENETAGIAGLVGDDAVVKKAKGVRRSIFAGMETFEVTDDVFQASIQGKKKYDKYEKYVGNCETGEAIRAYGRKNPSKSIVLKNEKNGTMLFLRNKGIK